MTDINSDKPKDPGHEPKQVGRPRLFATPEEFDNKVYEYQAYCKANAEPVTWTGLALFMGFSSRVSIDEYLKYDGFSYSVKRAKAFVEHEYEKRLCSDKPTGAIFALKNFGWDDKTQVDHRSGDGSMSPKGKSLDDFYAESKATESKFTDGNS